MKKQHTQKMTVRVTAQTAYNLERLMLMSGQKTPGRVVDKLVREKNACPAGPKTSKRIEVEVTNLPANSIAEMDRQGKQWRILRTSIWLS